MIKATKIILIIIIPVVLACVAWRIFYDLRPASAMAGTTVVFQVSPGEGFRTVSQELYNAGLVRSPFAFDAFAVVDGRAFMVKPGLYRLDPSMTASSILLAISGTGAGESTVTIPPGTNVYAVDRILSNALVIRPGALIALTSTQNLEGMLFPDTYEFYTNSAPADVAAKMEANFAAKAGPLLAGLNATDTLKTLTIASILEKEVPDQADQEVVAGIILKRLAAKMALDIDSTVCYAKLTQNPTSTAQACSLTALDFKIDSPYNTYLYRGLPPGPIGNPATSSIAAALHPQSSPYWYYLSDPATGKTIFATTLDEQNQNKVKYLESNN